MWPSVLLCATTCEPYILGVCIGYIGELQFVHVLYTVQGIPLYVNSNLYCVYNESHYCKNGG